MACHSAVLWDWGSAARLCSFKNALQCSLSTAQQWVLTPPPHAYRGLEQRKLCRIPPGVFIKLHQATWHAGPFFQEAQHMDFYNLELSDTNIADHCTHVYEGMQLVINTKRTMYDTFEP